MKLLSLKKIKARWFYSLRTRFVLLISLILIVIFGLIAFFLIDNARNTLINDLNHEVKAFSSLSVQPIGSAFITYQQSGSLLINQQMQKFTSLDSNVSNIAIVGLDGKSVFSLNGNPLHISPIAASNFMSTSTSNSKGQIVQIVEPYFDDSGVHSYAVVYAISTLSVNHSIEHEEDLILLFAVLGLIISTIATYLFLDNLFIRPVEEVSNSAGIIAAGYYSQQIQYNRQDEIGALATSLNRMANALKTDINKLEEVDKLKTEFITIASHNLRTPIAIIQGYIDVLKKEEPDEAAVEAIETSTNSLNDFTEQMLTIADVDSIRSPSFLENITLNELLQPLANDYTQIARTKGIDFSSSISGGDVPIHVNRKQLAAAVHNLLDNAVKFTEKGGSISLASSVGNTTAEIRVTDTGIGIDSSEFPKMFTKFHRGTDTLHYNYKGVGIGLYLTKLIVEQHGGTVIFDSQLGKGSTFIIKLPVQATN